MKRLIVIIVFSIFMTGCGQKTVDASTDESLKTSVEAMKKNLTTEQKTQFEDAVAVLAFSGVGNIFEAAANPEGMERRMKDSLNGKTIDEIINEANLIVAERQKKEKEQAIIEVEEIKSNIVDLEQKRSDAENASESLTNFKVDRSRFYYQESSYTNKPVIELTVTNNTENAVSRAYFEGVLSSPGRSVPWVQETFNYQIAGGLEPAETATWKLSPNMFGEWRNAPKDRKDMVLTVTVTRIDGADEKPIYDSEFSENNDKELKTLKDRLVELEKVIEG